ncbi:MAG: YkgJ family cysteine cluster protein [Bacteroidales bacterium]|nr:YkgJ family cysteine cluster protein [Bacteroidales bacterium]
MKFDPGKIKQDANKKLKENKTFLARLKSKKPGNLDRIVSDLHTEAFNRINCLDCGNCCRTLGPRILQKDIDRIAKFLGLKPDGLIANYLRIDEDGDYVFKSMPCPFLGEDNYCFIYEVRPKACAEYPHTNRRKFHQIIDLTLKNTETCPAVYEIIEGLKENYGR